MLAPVTYGAMTRECFHTSLRNASSDEVVHEDGSLRTSALEHTCLNLARDGPTTTDFTIFHFIGPLHFIRRVWGSVPACLRATSTTSKNVPTLKTESLPHNNYSGPEIGLPGWISIGRKASKSALRPAFGKPEGRF